MDINKELIKYINDSVKSAKKQFSIKAAPEIILTPPPKREFGDLSTNIAMQICKAKPGLKPMDIAASLSKDLKAKIGQSPLKNYIKEIQAISPGFINIFFSEQFLYDVLFQIEKEGPEYGSINLGKGKKVLIEFVSANPTGPLSIAHARQAAAGRAISKMLEFLGWEVTTEYFLNDEGRQIDLLGESIYARYCELMGKQAEFPEDGYRGGYIKEIAEDIFKKHKKKYIEKTKKNLRFLSNFGMKVILKIIKQDLKGFGVVFDNYTSQAKITSSNKIDAVLKELKGKDLIYEKDGALWIRSTSFGDDKDRVVIKSDGSYTYVTPDIAYHKEKYKRGFDWLIDIWGPDHHGYISRIRAAQRAFGKEDETLSILIVQLASIYRGGELLPMSTRAGKFITLRQVVDEVGADVAKFFFLMRRKNSHLDFDIELAKAESLENPVYYIQYAHARICGILEHKKKKVKAKRNKSIKPDSHILKSPEELIILRKLREYPDIIFAAYRNLEPHMIIVYLMELAGYFHSFYDKHRVVTDDAALTQARLLLVSCVKSVINSALTLLGISQPEKM